jgi:hypothetical protein
MAAVFQWVKEMLNTMRQEIKPPQANPITIIGEFMNSHIHNALVVNDTADSRSSMVPLPLMEPKGELMIRYEPDTKDLYIAATPFKKFCVTQQINYRSTLQELEKIGVFKEATNKRMSKGMKVASPAVRVLRFNAAASEFLQLEVPTDENRDGVVPD